MPFALFQKPVDPSIAPKTRLGDYARDALRVNPEQVEGLTSSYGFNTLLVVFSTLYLQARPALGYRT
jgi:hypothetical protein